MSDYKEGTLIGDMKFPKDYKLEEVPVLKSAFVDCGEWRLYYPSGLTTLFQAINSLMERYCMKGEYDLL